MTISARVLADSIHHLGPTPRRVTTFELRYNRFVHSEFMTHRLFSRNSASSRAIPVERMIADIENDPAMPVFWGKNCKGMQAQEEMTPEEIIAAQEDWLAERNDALGRARRRAAQGWHKQLANRPLEAWMHIVVIATATDFANFYHLRRDKMAQPEIQALANAMWDAHQASAPVDRTRLKGVHRWHLPLVCDEEREEFGDDVVKVCIGRCARVSYLTHDGKRDPVADIGLHDRLMQSGHWSPFEHAALPFRQPWWKRLAGHDDRSGNFTGWAQYRKTLPSEHPYQPGQVLP